MSFIKIENIIIWCILPMRKLRSYDVLLHKFYKDRNTIEDTILLHTEFFIAGEIRGFCLFVFVCVCACGYSHTQLP